MDTRAVEDAVYVGIDSGGTRTNIGVTVERRGEDPDVRRYEADEALSGALPRGEIGQVMHKIVATIEGDAHDWSPDLPVYVWISAAGFTPWTRLTYVQTMHEIMPELFGGSVKVAGAANDGLTLLLALEADAVIIAGTGSTVLVRSPLGEIRQAGGHEWVACDYGSGFWIGMNAIRKAYRDLEAGRTGSALLQRFRACYDVTGEDELALIKKLRELAIGHKHTKRDIAKFATTVCQAANNGIGEAQNVVKEEVEELADVAAEAFRRVELHKQPRPLKVIECGSLLANDFYRSLFEAQLEMRLLGDDGDEAQFTWKRMSTGDDAAVRMARRLRNDTGWLAQLHERFRPAIEHY